MEKRTRRQMATVAMMVSWPSTIVTNAMPQIVRQLSGLELISRVFASTGSPLRCPPLFYGKLADLCLGHIHHRGYVGPGPDLAGAVPAGGGQGPGTHAAAVAFQNTPATGVATGFGQLFIKKIFKKERWPVPFTIVRQDITKMKVDAIVNAANTELRMGGGVCGAIFRAAGADKLQAACQKLAPIKTGQAVITPGFGLPAQYVIHTAGPVYRDGKQGEEKLLRSCYLNSLQCAVDNNCRSVAFPLISSGIYGYPKPEALRVATDAIKESLAGHDLDVYLVVFD